MDRKLFAWGLRRGGSFPRLWLFTDDARLPDPLPSISRLPKGRAGVVFRHDDSADRIALGLRVARICRDRRLLLVIAGDGRLAARLHGGVHLRGGHRPDLAPIYGFTTSSAHSVQDIRRAASAGADLVFVSPAFQTRSHAGAPGLGPLRWLRMVRAVRVRPGVAALGGIDGHSIRRLPAEICAAAGAIGALA
jgi:thiamine-phosphate pyrophosphorylase